MTSILMNRLCPNFVFALLLLGPDRFDLTPRFLKLRPAKLLPTEPTVPFPSWQLTDITGTTGMAILQAIVKGERDPVKLAQLKHMQVKSNAETIASAPEGDYRPEHLFALKTST